ncbi:MAG: pantoate--beta-alanine ligase [Anaerolineales bacterium]|nr:pantoate--beta-alanine ligase [Anaerolineales bacterium]MCX7755934.1 pantoate--beta-alanine ligase [Anaerolineales bacterium]MDW8276880.1 pantoate--beta-alanine ligase [Anaerolineales bacterium]
MSDSMILVNTLEELWQALSLLERPLGLVPTMGYLHEGHLSLVRRARQECVSVAVSIFVNPTQFGPNEDLSRYPRDLERDLHLLEAAGADLVWIPSNEVMYPPGFQTWVTVETLTLPLEGAMRPGHFRGVTTVVSKLFNAVRPEKAYFGQKDAQQAAVIRQMTRDLSYPIEIVVCPTVREADGLAMSSRNTYLSPEERQAATVLFRALSAAETAYRAGERNAETLRHIMRTTIESEPLARLQYVSCADYDTLQELETVSGKALLSMAVFIGATRLIDNCVLG